MLQALFEGNTEAQAGFWGVVVGAALTLFGQLIAEFAKALLSARQRSNATHDRKRDFRRTALLDLQERAKELRAVLVEYEAADLPGQQLEQRLNTARAAFVVQLPVVEEAKVRQAYDSWMKAAFSWANEEGQSSAESAMWGAAARECGGEIRRNA